MYHYMTLKHLQVHLMPNLLLISSFLSFLNWTGGSGIQGVIFLSPYFSYLLDPFFFRVSQYRVGKNEKCLLLTGTVFICYGSLCFPAETDWLSLPMAEGSAYLSCLMGGLSFFLTQSFEDAYSLNPTSASYQLLLLVQAVFCVYLSPK